MGDQASIPVYLLSGLLIFPSLLLGRVTPKSHIFTFSNSPNTRMFPDYPHAWCDSPCGGSGRPWHPTWWLTLWWLQRRVPGQPHFFPQWSPLHKSMCSINFIVFKISCSPAQGGLNLFPAGDPSYRNMLTLMPYPSLVRKGLTGRWTEEEDWRWVSLHLTWNWKYFKTE